MCLLRAKSMSETMIEIRHGLVCFFVDVILLFQTCRLFSAYTALLVREPQKGSMYGLEYLGSADTRDI